MIGVGLLGDGEWKMRSLSGVGRVVFYVKESGVWEMRGFWQGLKRVQSDRRALEC